MGSIYRQTVDFSWWRRTWRKIKKGSCHDM